MRRNLQATGHTPHYQLQLRCAYLHFVAFVSSYFSVIVPKGRRFLAAQANDFLISYIQHLYDRHRKVHHATLAILSVQHFHRHLVRDLGAAWDSIRSWKTEVAIRLRPPVPLPLLKCFVIASFTRGLLTHLHEAHLWIPFGILLQVGFHGLLRPQELDALHRSHVILPSSSLFGTMSTCVLSIWQPKNRRFSGRAQFRTIRDALTVQWLEWLCKGLPPHAKLFPFGPHIMRRLFRELSIQLNLSQCHFSPASLRPGGATQFFLDEVPVDRIKFLGGWSNIRTLEHYIQEAVAIRSLLQLPQSVQQQLYAMHSLFPTGPRPPTSPWQSLFRRHP